MELKSPSAKLIAPPPVWPPLLLLLQQLLPSSNSSSAVERPSRNITDNGLIYRVKQRLGQPKFRETGRTNKVSCVAAWRICFVSNKLDKSTRIPKGLGFALYREYRWIGI
jgi:hypothetical protein